jgi:hypothetical protein
LAADKNGFLFKRSVYFSFIFQNIVNQLIFCYVFRTKLSLAHQNPEVFLELDDTIIKLIQLTDEPKLAEARELIERVTKNQLYEQISIEHEDFEEDCVSLLNKQFGDHFAKHRISVPYPEIPRNISLHRDGEPLEKYP